MSRHKENGGAESAAQIIAQVERILAAGERLRAALQTERWMDKSARSTRTASANQKWLQTRVATDRAEAAYREAIEDCYRTAEDASGRGGFPRREPGRASNALTPALKPVKHMFVAI